MPSIFSSKRTLRVKRVILGLQPRPSSPRRRRAGVGREHLLEELVALLGARLDDFAAAEDEPRPDHVVAEVDGRELGVGDHALGTVLHRAEEDLSVGHVAEARRDDALSSLDPDREVGAFALDVDRATPVEPLLDLQHPLLLGVPVEQAGVVDEVRVLVERHPRLLGRGGRSGTRRPPSGRRGCGRACLRAPVDLLEQPAALGIELGAGVDVFGRADRQPGVLLLDRVALDRRQLAQELERRLERPVEVGRGSGPGPS